MSQPSHPAAPAVKERRSAPGPARAARAAAGAAVPLAWSLAPAAVALLVYLLQVPSASGDKDGSEFTLVLATGGVAHPTGYPLYLMLGHAFVAALHGLGAGWAWAANAWSAVGGAVAILFLHALAVALIPADARLGPRQRFAAALLPAAIFGLNPIWSYEAVLAEVNSWHVAWTAAAGWYFAWLVRRLGSEREPWSAARSARHALGWGLLCGVGGAHHATAIFFAAPLSLAILWIGRERRRVGGREAALVVAAAALPLASYGFVAWRAFHPAAWQWPTLAPEWSSIVDHVTGAAYRRYLGAYDPALEQRAFLARYVYPFLAAALAALLAAFAGARGREHRWTFGGLAAAAMLATTYGFNYGVPDPSSYFLAPMAIGTSAVVALGASLALRSAAAKRATLAATAALALFAVGFGIHGIDLGGTRKLAFEQFDRRVHAMWESVRFDAAIVLWGNDMYTRMLEYQHLRGEKPGVDVLNPRILADESVRARFTARHGFDPLDGVEVPPISPEVEPNRFAEALGERIARNINARSPLPVIVFDPEHDSVRMMRKP